jgi:hypothetical protein
VENLPTPPGAFNGALTTRDPHADDRLMKSCVAFFTVMLALGAAAIYFAPGLVSDEQHDAETREHVERVPSRGRRVCRHEESPGPRYAR